MNRKYLPNRFVKHGLLWTAIFLTSLVLMTVLIGSVMAEDVDPLDFCIGVDHPPFEVTYSGNGNSYLKLGLTMSFEYYDEGSEFSSELSGSNTTETSNEMLDSNGQLLFIFPLFSYGSYDVTVFNDKGDMVFQNDVVVDDSEPTCDFTSLLVSPPREVIVQIPDVTEEVSEPTSEPVEVEETQIPETSDASSVSVVEEVDETVWWPLFLVGAGLLFFLIGLLIWLKQNCEKERKAWLAAAQHAAALTEKAREAEEAAEKLSEERDLLEEELADIQSTYPSAGKPGGDEAWIEMDGRRITSRDVEMKREEERAAWDEYRSDPNSDSASELEENWKESSTTQSEEERQELDEEAKALKKEIEAAKKAEDEAIEKAKNAKKAEDEAIEKANAARRIYEACIKAAITTPKSGPGTSDGPSGGPSVATDEEKSSGCNDEDPPQERNRVNLGRVSVPIKLKVTLDGGGAHKAAVAANDISGQLADASEALGWISKLMAVKSIGESLVRDGVGWSLLGAAAPPGAGLALDIPVPTSPGQLAVNTLSILGKISSVIIGKVPELQARRLPDCDVSATIENNVFSAECVEIWVCRNGQWVKDRKRFTLKLISKSSGRMTKRRALTWTQAQQVIRRYEQMYRGRLARGLDKLAELESRCQ